MNQHLRSLLNITLPIVAASAAVVLTACSGQTLDGGSNASGSSSGSDGTTSSGGQPGDGTASKGSSGTVGNGIPSTPVGGEIKGKPFSPKSVDVEFSKAQNQWFFAMRNYETDCRTITNKPTPSDALLVNIGGIEPAAGEFPIAYADGHGASFQVGVFESAQKADVTPAQAGVLRFDTWSSEPGATITGAIKLTNDDSNVAGTFTAKVCPAH